jgi:hypothetical protein
MVGDFVGGEAGRRRHLARQFEQVGAMIRIDRRDLAPRRHRREARARLDRQLVQRQMPRSETDGAPQFGLPRRFALPRSCIDQIEAHPIEAGLRHIERPEPLRYAMCAAEEAKHRVVQSLQAQADTVDPCRRQIGKARRLDRRGVRLQRDLDPRREPPAALRIGQDRGHGGGGHQRRRAAAEEDRCQWALRADLGLERQIREQGLTPAILINTVANMAVEIAIRTFGDAERPMHVQRQRSLPGHLRRPLMIRL